MKNLNIFSLLLLLSTFFFQAQQSLSFADRSKSSNIIAVATIGDSVNSRISEVAGRANYFLLFDERGVFIKSVKNPAQNRRGGASSVVVNLLLKESAKTLIAGKFGNKMVGQLKANKIEYHDHAGVANKIVETFIKKERSNNAKK